ncbi:MAG: aminopeptidase P family N-terminal domain-containing protein [Rhodospirillales bacterium]|nr:aminopeptidase P family N-terminal domain-containing protein [Rhodospirillales bacterium]
MRRGLLSWSKDDLPEAVFDGRVSRLRGAMAKDGLDALLVYTNFPRPAGISYLTHFVPYWSQCLLVVLPEGVPTIIVSLSKRVAGWIKETAHVSEVISTPNIGAELVALLDGSGAKSIGMVEMDKTPRPIVQALIDAAAGYEVSDASDLFASIRNPADAAEIALSSRAARMAADAMVAAFTDNADKPDLAVIERTIREAGAEDVFMDIAPDLTQNPRYIRADKPIELGARYAIRLSVAYDGSWIRYGRSFVSGGATNQGEAVIEGYLAEAIKNLSDGGDLKPLASAARILDPLDLMGVIAEGCIGCSPLQVMPNLPAGAVVSLGFTFKDDGGFWLADEPALLSSNAAEPAQRLALL